MKAFIFDLNGTMVDDMEYHAKAWLHLFNHDLGANFTPDEVKPQMYGSNPDVLKRMFGQERFTLEEMKSLSFEKEKRYQKEFLPHLKLLPGLKEFFERAYKKGIPMAIGSAAITFNINFVLDNLEIRHYFKAIISADDVKQSKPNPETFLKAAAALSITTEDCLVFEDVPKGAEAAANAGMEAVIITTTHTQGDFKDMPNIRCYAKDFNDDVVKALID